jgi:hypothetical protein
MLVIIFLPGGLVEGGKRVIDRFRGKSDNETASKQPAE